MSESTKALNESLKTKPSDFPLPKDLKLNFNPEIIKVRSAEVRTISDDEKVPGEDLAHGGYYQSKVPSVHRSDVKLPPRNVVVDEPWPQPLLPPLSPQRVFLPITSSSVSISLPSRYSYKFEKKTTFTNYIVVFIKTSFS